MLTTRWLLDAVQTTAMFAVHRLFWITAIVRRWVIFLKIGQNCDIEGKNSKCEFFLCYYLEMKA